MAKASHVVAADGSAGLRMIHAAASGGGVSVRIAPGDLDEGLAALPRSRSAGALARAWWKDLAAEAGQEATLPHSPEPSTFPPCYDRVSWLPERAVRRALDRPAGNDEILAQEFGARCSVAPRQPFCLLGQADGAQAVRAAWSVGPCQAYRASKVAVLGMGLLRDGADRLLLRHESRYCAAPAEANRARHLRAWLGPLAPDHAEPLPDLDGLAVEHCAIGGTTLLLAQPGQRIFGHWLLELLPRLWTARRLGLAFERVLLARHLPPGMEEALSWLGVEPRQQVRYEPQKQMPLCEDLLFLDALFDHHAFHPLAAGFYDRLAKDAAQEARRGQPPRLYLSRRRWHRAGRQLANRDELAPLLADAGFQEVHPETLPLRQQIALVGAAELIVADEGSGAHLAAFAPAGTGLLLLAPEGKHNPRHGAIARLRDLRYGWIIGENQDSPAGGEPDYRIAPDLLAAGLSLLAG